MNNAQKLLESILGVQQREEKPQGIQGILQTKNYSDFVILSDGGDELYKFSGAKLANKCLPGDHVIWNGERCILELRDEYPLIVGTLELTNKSKYGLTSRGVPIYLFTPYNKSYPHFIVGCSEKDISKNKIGVIKFDEWAPPSTFPRGLLQHVLGVSGDYQAEKDALVYQACPWKYPKGNYNPESKENILRKELKGYTFNIDPEGCKDIDDVLTFEEIDNNKWRVSITISDVARYVEDGEVVDIFASLIGQTLYDKNGKVVRAMLPREYSEQVCSLLPEKLSYGVTLQFTWDGKEITEKEWCETVFTNNKSYTYEEFQNSDSPYKYLLMEITSYLAKEHINDSHKWIEHCMLFYNIEAGCMLKKYGTGILRKHSEPNYEKLEKYKKYIPDLEKLALSSAEYCLADDKKTHHYGLQAEAYAHTSSPIRRYADLVNQRILKMILNNYKYNYIIPITMYDLNYRSKLNKNFQRDLDFLDAIKDNKTTFKAIILDKIKRENNDIKIKLYVSEWKRSISIRYKYISENTVLSRDERREIDVTDFKEVNISCAFNINSRNWKERIIINIL